MPTSNEPPASRSPIWCTVRNSVSTAFTGPSHSETKPCSGSSEYRWPLFGCWVPAWCTSPAETSRAQADTSCYRLQSHGVEGRADDPQWRHLRVAVPRQNSYVARAWTERFGVDWKCRRRTVLLGRICKACQADATQCPQCEMTPCTRSSPNCQVPM